MNNSRTMLTFTLPVMLFMLFSSCTARDTCPRLTDSPIPGKTQACPYITLAPIQGYEANKVYELRMMGKAKAYVIAVFNIEMVDSANNAVGEFVSGGEVCNDGTMLKHDPRVHIPSPIIVAEWKAPSRNVGPISIKFSVGASTQDYYTQCQKGLFVLRYRDDIPTVVPPTVMKARPEAKTPNPLEAGNTYCQPNSNSPIYRPVPGTECTQYTVLDTYTYAPTAVLTCGTHTAFSTRFCTCGFKGFIKCHVP